MYADILQLSAKFDPQQPRAPKGVGTGGQWVKGVWVNDPVSVAAAHATGQHFAEWLDQQAAQRATQVAQLAAANVAPPDPTHARSADITQMQAALTAEAQRVAPGITNRSVLQRAKMKEQIQKDLTARLIHDPAFAGMEPRPPMNLEPVSEWVKGQIDLWADTSGDHSNPAIRMQQAVQQEFGLSEAVMSHMGEPHTKNAVELARDRAFVRAEYERTQEWFKAQGITHVTAFRGMDDEGSALGYGYNTVTMQPASSWSTDLEIAFAFATNKDNPKILTTRVPVSQVLSTCVTGRGCLTEEEVILLGKPQRARVFGVTGDTFYTDAPEVKKILGTLE